MRALTRACVLGVTIGLSAPGNASASELEGTGWRLLNITSMDDTIDVPDDPSKYTLEFAAENRAAMVADCNRGAGTWSSDSPPQLTFGPIAATRALCLPPSLSEKYLAQFEWVRSFMIKGGHLFLATMADGSIIEFEPLPPVVATVLGDEIRARDVPEMQAIIVTRLFDRYAADNGIEVTESELDAYIDRVRRGIAAGGLTAADDLTPDERLEVEAMRRQMGHAMIRQWKINKSLYESYGGRIIYQQLGPEPLDAYHQYLEEREQAGDFAILNPDMRPAFWRYFTDVSMHDFMKPGGDDEANAFATPPYQ
ncbi:MAG: META domain-containing protein [Pseudomonadales bacterium]|nr:META domain-containing protein [Pseudomonadales bacterium]